MKKDRLKVVSYSGVHGDRSNPRNKVAYLAYGQQIVFSGLHNGDDGARGSTMNFAEEIILAISRQEGIDPRTFAFYDLQTLTGYSDADYVPGSYRFDELQPRWNNGIDRPVSMGWREGHCADQVLADFAGFIWGNSPPGTPRNLAVAYGSIKPLPAEQPVVS